MENLGELTQLPHTYRPDPNMLHVILPSRAISGRRIPRLAKFLFRVGLQTGKRRSRRIAVHRNSTGQSKRIAIHPRPKLPTRNALRTENIEE